MRLKFNQLVFGHRLQQRYKDSRNYHVYDVRGTLTLCGCCACIKLGEYVPFRYGSMQKNRRKYDFERSKYRVNPKPIIR